MTVLKKLMQARIKLQGMKLKKTGVNEFARYKYFELGDFLPQVQEIFNDLGLAGVVSYRKEDADLTITCLNDNSTVVITTPMAGASLKGCHDVQNLGAIQTYIRRYLWVTALEIVENDAIDSSPPNTEKPKKKELDVCSDDKFNSMREEWKNIVEGGKGSEFLINALSTKTLLTDAQKDIIKSWEGTGENS